VVAVGCVVTIGGASHNLQCRERMFVVGDVGFGCVLTPPWVGSGDSMEISGRVPALSPCELLS